LSVVKPDLHLDNPYPLADTITAAKFLLTGSTFRSTTFLPESSGPSFWTHPQPYQSATSPPFSEMKPESTATNQYSFGRSCGFCGNFGHFTRTCLTVIQYIRAGKAIQGADGRLYLPDGSRIPRFAAQQFIRQCIDHAEAEKVGAMHTNTTHSRDPQPHITAGILTVTYPEPERDALLDIEPPVFTTSVQVSPSLSITDPEFQAYLAKAWDCFIADKVSGIRFTDVTDPPGQSARPDPQVIWRPEAPDRIVLEFLDPFKDSRFCRWKGCARVSHSGPIHPTFLFWLIPRGRRLSPLFFVCCHLLVLFCFAARLCHC
jgi:hypothetical protein